MEKKYTTIQEGNMLRIKALRAFGIVEEGELGGLIESEKNLSQYGNAWVYGDAEVSGNARVFGDAWVYGNAWVYGDAEVSGNARVFGDAWVYGNAWVYGDARVFGDARVSGDARVFGDAWVYGDARVYGDAWVFGNARVFGDADIIVFKNWWSSGRWFTWTRSNDMWKVGCFYGTGEELIKKAYADSELSGREYERVVKYVESIKETVNELSKNA